LRSFSSSVPSSGSLMLPTNHDRAGASFAKHFAADSAILAGYVARARVTLHRRRPAVIKLP
jgi:hypothetical protein